jgi:hypothetical protein
MPYPDNSRALEQVGTWDPPEDDTEFGILDARVDWMEKWSGNSPVLQILLTKVFDIRDFSYERLERKNNDLYWAERDGQVSYYAHTPGNQRGFGGRTFELPAADPKVTEPYKIKGPWSSRCSVMNDFWPPSTEASIIDKEEGFKRGYTFMAGAVTVEAALAALDIIYENTGKGYALAHYEHHGEYNYEIVKINAPGEVGETGETIFKREKPKKYDLLYPCNLYHDLFECPEEESDNELSNGGYDI